MNKIKFVLIVVAFFCFCSGLRANLTGPVTTYGNLSVGKFYKFSAETSSSYQDNYPCLDYSDGSKLTNELTGLSWPLDEWVGWHNEQIDIVLDLGKVYKIDRARLNSCSRTGWSIYFPTSLEVYISEDETMQWQKFGDTILPPADTNGHTAAWLETTAEKTSARFVKFSMPNNGNHLFVSEIEVYGEIKNTWKNVPEWGCYHGAFPVDTSGNMRISSFEEYTEKTLSMVLWYHHMGNSTFDRLSNLSNLLRLDTGGHRYLSIGWLPDISAELIGQGQLDEYLNQWFTDSLNPEYRNHRSEPIWIRPMNEMNGGWVEYGLDPDNYRRAWRRMYNIAEQIGTTEHDIFVWSPNHRSYPDEPWNNMDKYYPGDHYVDWVGISAYPPSSGIVAEEERYPRGRFTEFYNLYSDRKPLMIAEGGVSDTVDQNKWVQEWFDCLKNEFPMIKAAIWENHNDRRIELYPDALATYQQKVADPYFLGNIYGGNVEYNNDGFVNLGDLAHTAAAWQYSTEQLYSYFDSFGLLVFEAEGYSQKFSGSNQTQSHSWQLLNDNSSAIGGYMQALPNDGIEINDNIETDAPRLSYNLYFAIPGTYYFWIKSAAGAEDDTGYFGLNGNVIGQFSIRVFFNFLWKSNAAVFEVDEPGFHTFDIWMGKDGLKIDRVIITNQESFSMAAEPPISQFANGPVHPTDINADAVTDIEDLLIFSEFWLK